MSEPQYTHWPACSTVAQSLPMVKPATVAVCCCKTRSFLPHRCRRERGWRLAKNHAVGMLFLNKDPELAKAARRIVRRRTSA
ncbi:hypothetical protein LNP74_09435 [Klebsiella pneumoniae subsp. pneumoniae]|nr:hypothetical protein [Klebsiella pneumoniae subsp. pneumoniae]